MLLRSMIVVITGASKGIGKAVATEFAKKGYTLYYVVEVRQPYTIRFLNYKLPTRMPALKQGPPICPTKQMYLLLQPGV